MSVPDLRDAETLAAFKDWLIAAGAKLTPPTNGYEIVRFSGARGVSVVYRNDHGRPLRMMGDARPAWDAFCARKTLELAPPKPLRAGATIFSDASFCPRSHAAGWAAWIKSSSEAGVVIGGQIQTDCASPQQAEIFALANAVNAAHVRGLLGGPGETVSLQSDCTAALYAVLIHVPGAVERRHAEGAAVTGRYLNRLEPSEHAALDLILSCVCEAGVQVAVRHVRGHTAGGGRQWVNERCDRVAKRHMNDQRAERSAQPWAPLPGEAPSPSSDTQQVVP